MWLGDMSAPPWHSGSPLPFFFSHFSFDLVFLNASVLVSACAGEPFERATVIKKLYCTSNSSLSNMVKVTFSKPLNPWLPHWTVCIISQASICSHSPQLSIVEPQTVRNAWGMSVSAQIGNFCKYFSGEKNMNSLEKQIRLIDDKSQAWKRGQFQSWIKGCDGRACLHLHFSSPSLINRSTRRFMKEGNDLNPCFCCVREINV